MRIFPVTPSIESLPQNIVRYFRYFRDGQSISIDRIVIHRKCAIVEMESRKNDRPSSRPSLSLSLSLTGPFVAVVASRRLFSPGSLQPSDKYDEWDTEGSVNLNRARRNSRR